MPKKVVAAAAEAEQEADGGEEGKADFAAEQQLDSLTEKRASTRIAGLKGLVKFLSQTFSPDFVFDRKETIIDCITKCLKKGDETEARLSLELFQLVCVYLGSDMESLARQFCAQCEIALKKTTNPSVKSSLYSAFSFAAFLCLQDEEEVVAIANTMSKAIGDKPQAGAAELLTAFILTLTVLPAAVVNDDFFPEVANDVMTYLSHSDVEVRSSAGEALAFLIQQQRGTAEDGFDLADIDGYLPVDELLTTLHSFVENRAKQTSKKDRRVERAAFRDIIACIEDGTSPSSSFTVKHQTVHVDSWERHVQCNALRLCLADGFYVHALDNTIVHDVLGTDIDSSFKREHLNKAEKRAMFSPNSKAAKDRTQTRGRDRSTKKFLLTGDM